MKRHLLIIACAMPLVAYGAYAADTPDSSFYKKLAEGGLAEVSDATLAQQSATDPKLKDFAAMMIKDHTEANNKLSALAGTKNLTLPTSASVTEMATHEKLKLESGTTFDKSYIKGQISAHRATIRLLRKELASGQDQDAKDFAKSILPTVQGHLKAIDALATADGVSTK
jgi:putative membrane protein